MLETGGLFLTPPSPLELALHSSLLWTHYRVLLGIDTQNVCVKHRTQTRCLLRCSGFPMLLVGELLGSTLINCSVWNFAEVPAFAFLVFFFPL